MSFFNRNNPYLGGQNSGSNATSEPQVYQYSGDKKGENNRVFVDPRHTDWYGLCYTCVGEVYAELVLVDIIKQYEVRGEM